MSQKSKTYNKFLCKAKTCDEAKWVEGYPSFYETTNKNYEGEEEKVVIPYFISITDEGIISTSIIPETLCKVVVGASDSEGNYIFSGDILEEVVDKKSIKGRRFYKPTKVEVVEAIAGFVFVKCDESLKMEDRIVSVEDIANSYIVVGNKWDDLRIIKDEGPEESEDDDTSDGGEMTSEIISDEVSEPDLTKPDNPENLNIEILGYKKSYL